ncbi:MAG: tRNA guanosine(34) transglycosylase Tgt [Clostridiales Family XIII bacterium]|jgi:queuine tRNA-ribosyltransferase|nr:tRNA guanosine(34) transglycosylase Tgt [Clostridiales Family XIII bacterium]
MKKDDACFELVCADGRARRGRLTTAHGVVETPVFMPVGTAATVKGVKPEDVRALGAQILLANTYHLYLRPGHETVAKAGGLHRFMHWDGPILTDSGGFQVFSLAGINQIREEGVTFQSHIDGSRHLLSPEKSMEIQHALGADVIMAFDECVPYPAERAYVEASVGRTTRWLERCLAAHRRAAGCRPYGGEAHTKNVGAAFCRPNPRQLLFGIQQGGMFKDLRRLSSEQIAAFDLPGYAIGGLSVGEPKEVLFDVLDDCADMLPKEKPRYLMGVGTPDILLEGVARGVDMFDCVLPTREARHGRAMTRDGSVNLRNAKYAEDFAPLDEACGCETCRHYSKAYLRHLIQSKEMLGATLLSIHNLHFLTDLMAGARAAIEAGAFERFKRDALDRYYLA